MWQAGQLSGLQQLRAGASGSIYLFYLQAPHHALLRSYLAVQPQAVQEAWEKRSQ